MPEQGKHNTSTLSGVGHPSGGLADSLRPSSPQIKPPQRHCSNPRGWLWMRCKHGTNVLVPLKCGGCDACLERRRAKHVARISYAILEFPPCGKLEVTSTPGATWLDLMRAWQQMMRRIRQVAPGAEYAAIKEEGPDTGMLHLHVILTGWRYISQRQLSTWWLTYSGAPVVWIRRVASRYAAHYVAKHLTKGVDHMRNPVTYSRGFPRQEFEAPLQFICKCRRVPDDWQLTHVHGWGILLAQLAPGCDCFKDADPLHDGERAWLALISDRSPPRYPDG